MSYSEVIVPGFGISGRQQVQMKSIFIRFCILEVCLIWRREGGNRGPSTFYLFMDGGNKLYRVTVPFLQILNILTGVRAEKGKIWNGMGQKRVGIRYTLQLMAADL